MEQLDGEQPDSVAAWLLVCAVGLAFADASVVVLALPSLYGTFDTTIVGISWVLTAYALVVAVVGLSLAPLARRLRPMPLTAAGLVVFAVASAVCGLAQSLTWLMLARCLQGVGAGLLLAGALPVLVAVRGAESGRRQWSRAATVGLAVGPALGGVLTEVFSWRAIFLVQAPVALAALAVAADPQARRAVVAVAGDRPRLLANLGFVFLSGGLVGALFLGVLLVIEVWRYSPLAGAGIVTTLPAVMFLAQPLAVRLAPVLRVTGGALLLAGGLAALGLLPSADPGWAVAALALCGAGLAMLASVFDPAAVGPGGVVRDGSLAVGARHVGLVLGLVLIAPVLAGSLDHATERSAVAGTAAVLDARVSVQDKAKIVFALRDQLSGNPRGEVPDLAAAVSRTGASPAAGAVVGKELAGRVENVLTRSFRPAFGIAAGLSLAALVPGLLLGWRRRRTGSDDPPPSSAGFPAHPSRGTAAAAVAGLVALLVGAGGVLGAELAAGARDYGRYAETEPCHAPADPYPGSGLDATVQRVAFSVINGAACEVGVSRERVVLSLDGNTRFGGPRLDRPRLERVLRAGLRRAVDDAEKRGDLPGWAAAPFRALAERAPLSQLLDLLGVPT